MPTHLHTVVEEAVTNNDNNYHDLANDLKETLEAIEREGKERGLNDKEILNEYILSYIAEQERKQQATLIFRFNSILRVFMPLIMSNEDVRLKVIKVYDEIVQSLKRQLDEATRMREEIRERGKTRRRGREIETSKVENVPTIIEQKPRLSMEIRCAYCGCLPSECKDSPSPKECPNCTRVECCCWAAPVSR